MTQGGVLILNLVIAITIVIGTIVVLRWSPMVALILGSLSMGLGSGLELDITLGKITEGFGGLMAGIGLSIGFGVIIGQLLYDCGGARAVAHGVVRRLPEAWVLYGLGLTAFLFSIPVFFDVTFVVLVPLAVSLSAELKKPLPYAVGAVVIGAGTAHTLVPPTPNPLAAAEILDFDLGLMILAGLIIGLGAALVAMKILFLFLDWGLWSKARDEAGESARPFEEVPLRPASAGWSLLPIALALLLILMGTVWTAVFEDAPAVIRFFSHKVVAMLCGAVAAYLVASRTLTRTEQEESVSRAMASAGVVLLVTGAGGAFGAVIEATGIGRILADMIGRSSHAGLMAVVATYGMAVMFRVSQGSGTVASITTMTIVAGAGLAATAALHPVWLALAALSGGMSIGHVNDSGFWVVTKLSGFSLSGGLKTYTLGEFIVSSLVFIMALMGSLILPRF